MPNHRLLVILLTALCAHAADDALTRQLNAAAQTHLDARARAVAQIQTRDAAEHRKSQVREKLLQLIGGLPTTTAPLATKQYQTSTRDGFRLERVVYDSLLGFHVTADVYVPTQSTGPFPAVVLTSGHGATGKASEYSTGANFARNGIVALAYDPIGEGERLQYFDPELGGSKVGGPTSEHSMSSAQSMLLGDQVARYFVWDAMRSIDYLISRSDVDAKRIGALGCSGGGTVTAYLAVLDDRVQAAGTACYITSFQELLPKTGPQEAEQSIPHFLENNLDFADFVELVAPKPYAIISTTSDMFPIEGARQTYEEASRIYGLYGAADRLQWIKGPGGHGALGPIYPDILAFFTKFLKHSDERPTFSPQFPDGPDDVLVTPTGQVSTSLGGENIATINRKRAESILPKQPPAPALLKDEIRTLAGVTAQAGAASPAAAVKQTSDRPAYRMETIVLEAADGIDIPGVVAIPKSDGAKAATLILDQQPLDRITAPGSYFDKLANSGRLVLLLQPRLIPPEPPNGRSALLGSAYTPSLRALLLGKTFAGMRIDDTIRAVDWLCSRPDVDHSAIAAYGNGALGVVLLHAATLDPRIGRVMVENALAAYRMAIDQPISKNISEIMIPGVLRNYDLPDLLKAIAPRPVTIVNPVDAMGNPLRQAAYQNPSPANVRVLWRLFGQPLPE